jgi:hypothetical protein
MYLVGALGEIQTGQASHDRATRYQHDFAALRPQRHQLLSKLFHYRGIQPTPIIGQ